MLIHCVLCIWCQTFTCLNFTFTVTLSSALHLGNTSIKAKYLKTVFICRFASENRCHNCGKLTVIAFFNHCLSLIAYDLHKEQYCNSGNNSSGTATSMLAFCRDSKKSASQNNKLSAKIRILCLIQAYNLICLSKYSIFASTVI